MERPEHSHGDLTWGVAPGWDGARLSTPMNQFVVGPRLWCLYCHRFHFPGFIGFDNSNPAEGSRKLFCI
jgi:hypothetical protein